MSPGKFREFSRMSDTRNMFYNDAKCHPLHIRSRYLGVNYVISSHQGLTTLEKTTNE